jgi:hypothetical protein
MYSKFVPFLVLLDEGIRKYCGCTLCLKKATRETLENRASPGENNSVIGVQDWD